MAFMDLFRKKKEDDLGFGDLEKDLGVDLGMPELGETPPPPSMPDMPGAPTAPPRATQPFSMDTGPSSPQAFQEQPSLTPSPLERQVRELPPPGMQNNLDSNSMFAVRKEIEVLSSKMDAIRSALESMSQRLINIERMAMYEQEKKRSTW